MKIQVPGLFQKSQVNLYEKFRSNFIAAADWLCSIQESNGVIPAIIDPVLGAKRFIDWSRLPLTAWSLVEFGKAVKEEKYINAGKLTLGFLRNHFKANDFAFRFDNYLLPWVRVFYGELALALGASEEAYEEAIKIKQDLDLSPMNPNLFSYIANFFIKLSRKDQSFLELAEALMAHSRVCFKKDASGASKIISGIKSIFSSFSFLERRSSKISLYAGLYESHQRLFEATEKTEYKEFSIAVLRWIKSRQFKSGGFPGSIGSGFSYTRGCARIFEVLAIDPARNSESIDRALSWIVSMQYNRGDYACRESEIGDKLIGGFRHDDNNGEAWIDAAGHLLLGAARLVQKS